MQNEFQGDKDTTPIGPQLARILDVARAAGLPVLLVGRHGIGKSEFLESYAHARGIRPYVLDLSLLEATDLTGMPFIREGTTHFAPPGTLPPAEGESPAMLVLEELNRCDRSVRQPCLQLLTARRLNDYRLPESCFVAACVNPPETGYDVDELDPALASRFVTLRVVPDRTAWAAWARQAGIMERLVAFIEKHTQSFDKTPPRSWAFAARLAHAALEQGWRADEIEVALRTVLPPITAHALQIELSAPVTAPPTAVELLRDPRGHIEGMRRLTDERRLDVIKQMLDGLLEHLRTKEGAAQLAAPATRRALHELVAAAPPDLRVPIETVLEAQPERP